MSYTGRDYTRQPDREVFSSAIDHALARRLRVAETMEVLDSKTIGWLSMAIETRNKISRDRPQDYVELVEQYNETIKRLLGL